MAVTRLTNVIVPEVFFTYMAKDTAEKASIFQSGAVVQDAALAEKLAGGGTIFQMPFWNDLAQDAENIADDDPSSTATPKHITASKMRAIRHYRTQGWSDADLVAELAGSDPMERILARVNNYWNLRFQTAMIQTLKGVFADNVANDSGDMVYDITAETGDDAKISADAVLETAQTMGDASDKLKLIVMHSRVYTTLAKQNLIDFIPNSEGKVLFPTYLGYNIVKNDNVLTETSGGDTYYWTYLMGPGALSFAESPPDVPVETFRYPDQGNGSGVEVLWTRRQFAMHPMGFDWTSSSLAGSFPTNTELANAANWDRKVAERKQVNIAALKTKNG